jgi:hypothetical protein
VVVVRVDAADHDQELRLGEADARALDLASPRVPGSFGTFRIETPLTDTDDLPFRHCFEEDAVVVATDTGATEAVVEAGTCIENGRSLDLTEG